MRRLTPSGKHKTIQSIWDWYEHHLRLVLANKAEILAKLARGDPSVDTLFFGMARDEIDRFFAEVDNLVMLDLLAATEAAVRLDFWERVDKRKKDDVSKHLRKLYKEKGLRLRLDGDILEAWKNLRPATKTAVSDYCRALNLRHWLAHGRYWDQEFKREYAPGDIYDIADSLLTAMVV